LRREDGSLSATGFTLGQEDITDLPGFKEVFDVAAAQVTLADLQVTTGLGFGPLLQHDHFAKTKQPGALEIKELGGVKRRVKPIRTFDDIVM
jgi:hypothetical protein